MLSGVARSVNFYPIGSEKPQDGIVNVAFGLGKMVVDGGNTLRFSPKSPKKILQLSDPKLALRDTQKTMFALDLNPAAFKISKDDGINIVKRTVYDGLADYDYPELAASTFSMTDGRLVPGVNAEGARIISFDAILKYGRFPLSRILSELMEICRKELMCDVEMEFALDVIPDSHGQECVLKLLQVRPVSEFADDSGSSLEKVAEEMGETVLTSEKALGKGRITGMKHIVYVSPDTFDSAHTGKMAEDISRINAMMKDKGQGYLLVGPGRWGSSDPWLGIPVLWSDISEAKMIVECGIPGYRIEPSQGTHFFQNITSLGVGYLTIDTVSGDGDVNYGLLDSMETVYSTGYVKVIELKDDLVAYIDRKSGKSIVGLQKA